MAIRYIRRPRAALRLLDPDQDFFHDAYISVPKERQPTLVTKLRNPELFGIWELSYNIDWELVAKLLWDRVELGEDSKPEERIYRLKKK